MNIRRITALALAVFVCTPALAADFDGSKALICAPTEAMDCVADEDCTRGSPAAIGAPAFIRLDVTKKTIAGPKQTAKILYVDKTADRLLLQGTEFGYGWTMALEQASGKLVTTLVDENGVFVLFGACTPL
ncbi:MAG TPA: hypothetical protein VGO34_15195 [Alphaproteobacteria bacterium]|jgi:hypothetical protein